MAGQATNAEERASNEALGLKSFNIADWKAKITNRQNEGKWSVEKMMIMMTYIALKII